MPGKLIAHALQPALWGQPFAQVCSCTPAAAGSSAAGYTGSCNLVDLAQLRWRDLSFDTAGVPERLHYVRQKTGGKFATKLTGPAAAIVAAYEPLTRYFLSADEPALQRKQLLREATANN